jgi:transposase InsO family protein
VEDASKDFSDVLKEHGITPSMSRKGNCRGSTCSETLLGSLKVKRQHGQRFEIIRKGPGLNHILAALV